MKQTALAVMIIIDFDKIIFIGRDNFTSSQDYILTPYSRDIVAMSNLEMHANIMDTLIQNRAVM